MNAPMPGLAFAAMAALLRQGRLLAACAWLLLAAALAAMLFAAPRPLPVALSVLAAALHVYYAVRVDLDARLFDALARDGDPATSGSRLDAALQASGLRRGSVPDRPWPQRFAGARGLLVRQGVVLVVQALTLAWACWR